MWSFTLSILKFIKKWRCFTFVGGKYHYAYNIFCMLKILLMAAFNWDANLYNKLFATAEETKLTSGR